MQAEALLVTVGPAQLSLKIYVLYRQQLWHSMVIFPASFQPLNLNNTCLFQRQSHTFHLEDINIIYDLSIIDYVISGSRGLFILTEGTGWLLSRLRILALSCYHTFRYQSLCYKFSSSIVAAFPCLST